MTNPPGSLPRPGTGRQTGPLTDAAPSWSDEAGAHELLVATSLQPEDRPRIAELVRTCGLPRSPDDGEPDFVALVSGGDGKAIGYAACQRHGDAAVLRRIAVCPDARKRGIGSRLMGSILRQMIASGVQSVALLAIGGQDFFERFGFIAVVATDLSPVLRATGHFAGARPGAASPMVLDLGGATLVRPARREDMPAVLAIYNDAVAQSTATYDYEPRTLEEQVAQFDQKMLDGYGFYAAVTPDGTVAGYATYGLYRTRPGWRFACEHSVYVAVPWRGRRVGLGLLPPIMRHARKRGFHTMIGVVDAQNEASLRMHRRAGFADVGVIREGGHKFDRWLDVAFLQAML